MHPPAQRAVGFPSTGTVEMADPTSGQHTHRRGYVTNIPCSTTLFAVGFCAWCTANGNIGCTGRTPATWLGRGFITCMHDKGHIPKGVVGALWAVTRRFLSRRQIGRQ
jgi:hypothetical protein